MDERENLNFALRHTIDESIARHKQFTDCLIVLFRNDATAVCKLNAGNERRLSLRR